MKGTRSGSSMSKRQLARTVAEGRKLTFYLSTGDSLDGYLCGLDDFHWMVVSSDAQQDIVHKGSVTRVRFGEPEYDAEPKHDILEAVIAPFRSFLVRENLIPQHLVPTNASNERATSQ